MRQRGRGTFSSQSVIWKKVVKRADLRVRDRHGRRRDDRLHVAINSCTFRGGWAMRNMSFMLTTDAVLNRTKTVTRRLGWARLAAGSMEMG